MITSLPTEQGLFDLSFEDGFEISDIKYEVFKSKYLAKFICIYKSSQLVITYAFENNPRRSTNFKYEQIGDFESTKEAIEVYSFLQRLAKSLSLTVYLKKHHKPLVFKMPPDRIPLEEMEASLEYYNSLKQVEVLYNTRFTNIEHPKQLYYDRVLDLIKFSKPVLRILRNNEFKFELVGDKIKNIEELKKAYEQNTNFEVVIPNHEKVEIHGKVISLSYKIIEILWPYTLNLNELIEGKTEVVRVETKQVKISYKK